MVFVVANREHGRLRKMTEFLLMIFPGSTIYQHTSLAHALGDVLRHRVDAVFVAGEQSGGSELMQMLEKKKLELPVLLHSDIEGIGYGHFPQAIVEQRLRNVLLTAKVEGGQEYTEASTKNSEPQIRLFNWGAKNRVKSV